MKWTEEDIRDHRLVTAIFVAAEKPSWEKDEEIKGLIRTCSFKALFFINNFDDEFEKAVGNVGKALARLGATE